MKIGDKVKVINYNDVYPNYTDKFVVMGFTKYNEIGNYLSKDLDIKKFLNK